MNTLRKTLAALTVPFLLVACSDQETPIGEDNAESSSSVSSAMMEDSSSVTVQSSAAMSDESISAETTGETESSRVILITAEDWQFSPSTIVVERGEDVVLEITGVEGRHGFAIPELGINQAINPGETVRITLDTSTAGEFAFRCSIPCGPGHRDMVGTIVINA